MISIDFIKTLPQYVFPKLILNRFAKFMANLRIPIVKNHLIQNFIKDYNVNMAEALDSNPLHYVSFNEFFIRRLKPEARPISTVDVVSPVDGCISEIGYLSDGQLLQAKDHYYSVSSLLAGKASLYSEFQSGCFATIYLSPKDYHRVHMPIDGVLVESIYVPGSLFSVQPRTVSVVPNLFARNERLVVIFSTPMGSMAMILVGAAIVGAMGTVWQGDLPRSSQIKHTVYTGADAISLSKAMEMGYFKLGSTVILLFANQQLKWLEQLKAGSLVQLGQALCS